MITHYTGFDAERAAQDLRRDLFREAEHLTDLIMRTAHVNIRHYPNVRNYLQKQVFFLGNGMLVGEVSADHWEAWLEQFGKGSMMAGPQENRGLVTYMNSEAWNKLRSRTTRAVLGRWEGSYKGIDGTVRYSGGSYAGRNLEALAQSGELDAGFLPTPPSFFMRNAVKENRNRIMQGFMRVIQDFPYHRYFLGG
ncbi:hypothetical protein [Paenibacillus sp. UMB4589-SE434]|uniref:hypothetical protein n=1 Tax=Paenibacillus sp. UMB4589-SE434 TaxID=3046314 RepID=UPI00254D6835|nr:hypothetical protein [Paenibacillus sp. UMB4589-SE434]MDK8182111.1 hypothetical protein [Paenibacillus sp. UMB4589-SE434]